MSKHFRHRRRCNNNKGKVFNFIELCSEFSTLHYFTMKRSDMDTVVIRGDGSLTIFAHLSLENHVYETYFDLYFSFCWRIGWDFSAKSWKFNGMWFLEQNFPLKFVVLRSWRIHKWRIDILKMENWVLIVLNRWKSSTKIAAFLVSRLKKMEKMLKMLLKNEFFRLQRSNSSSFDSSPKTKRNKILCYLNGKQLFVLPILVIVCQA